MTFPGRHDDELSDGGRPDLAVWHELPDDVGSIRQSDGAATADLRCFDKFVPLPPTLLSRADEVIE